jgi:hypothetical protein
MYSAIEMNASIVWGNDLSNLQSVWPMALVVAIADLHIIILFLN